MNAPHLTPDQVAAVDETAEHHAVDPVHEIVQDGPLTVGTDGEVTVTLMQPGRMFKRRAVKGVGSGHQEEQCWLVTELNGVRVYQRGNQVLVTTEDLYP